MLKEKFTYDYFKEDKKEYALALRKDRGWKKSKERVLILLQTVPSDSLKEKDILAKGLVSDTIINSIHYAEKLAVDRGVRTFSKYAVANFNAYRHLHNKSPQARREAERDFTERAKALIKTLKPTKVLISGDYAAARLLNLASPDYAGLMRGRVYEVDKIKYVHTVDLEALLAKKGKSANLLGFYCRHLSYLLEGKHPYSLKKLYPTPKYIGTVEQFDAMLKELKKAKLIAIDTETKNLTVHHNAIYTIQFATELTGDVGYVLPYKHPQTPFSTKEQKYIGERLTAMLGSSLKGKEVVKFNGAFDARIIRQEFDLPILNYDIWEITAGEHDLDENVTSLKDVGPAHGGLMATLARYDNDFYITANFSKADRATTGAVAPSDPEFLKYAAMDVVALIAIYKMQQKQASVMKVEGKPYLPIYRKHVLYAMGPTTHQLSHLSQDGSLVDKSYLRHLLSSTSPLREEIKKAADAMRVSKAVQEANHLLLKEAGIKANSLFGRKAEQWVFMPSKPKHRALLFFEVKGLEPVSQTATGEPAVDKEFLAHYKDDPDVALYTTWNKTNKLLSTFVRGWYKILNRDEDSLVDSILRPYYTFFGVLTGRLNSAKPNLQQVPSRGSLASIIKRLFIAPKGRILIRYDYSAHEVRGWANIAGDKALAENFKIGQSLRQQWIKDPTENTKTELRTKGDLHILNVKRFFNKWIERSDPLRDAIKAVVFGVLYGMSAKTLGEDVGKDENYAQSLIDKMFSEFKRGADWLSRMKKLCADEFYVYSVLGRRRNLYAALTKNRTVVSRQVRMGSNAPIQGMSSEIGVIASRLIMQTYYEEAKALAKYMKLTKEQVRLHFNRIVHDANYFDTIYEMVLPMIHVLQYESTYGVTKYLEEHFGFPMQVEPEIEIEIGVQDDRTYAWDWSLPNLIQCLVLTVLDGEELGVLDGTPKEVMDRILRPHRDPKVRKRLQKRFPLLNVTDLEKVITKAEADYLKSIKGKPEYKLHAEVLGR